jgi:hypothetical protein
VWGEVKREREEKEVPFPKWFKDKYQSNKRGSKVRKAKSGMKKISLKHVQDMQEHARKYWKPFFGPQGSTYLEYQETRYKAKGRKIVQISSEGIQALKSNRPITGLFTFTRRSNNDVPSLSWHQNLLKSAKHKNGETGRWEGLLTGEFGAALPGLITLIGSMLQVLFQLQLCFPEPTWISVPALVLQSKP